MSICQENLACIFTDSRGNVPGNNNLLQLVLYDLHDLREMFHFLATLSLRNYQVEGLKASIRIRWWLEDLLWWFVPFFWFIGQKALSALAFFPNSGMFI